MEARTSRRRIVLQLLGFAVGLGLLAWLVFDATKPENREQLKQLLDAPLHSTAALLALTAGSMVLNGALFWIIIRPHRDVPFVDVQAVNSIAYLLSGLPLRGGFLFRIFVHNRRNGVPLIVVAGWMAAVAILIVVGFGPPVGATFVTGSINNTWWAITLTGIAFGAGATILVARIIGLGGTQMLQRIIDKTILRRFITEQRVVEIREGVKMLELVTPVVTSVVLRLADLMLQAMRFVVAGELIGVEISGDQAILAACVFFVADSIAPTGSLGAREAITAGVMATVSDDNFKLIVLTVSAGEMVVRSIATVIGLAWLLPGGLFVRRGKDASDSLPPVDPE